MTPTARPGRVRRVVVIDDMLPNALLLKGLVKRLDRIEAVTFTDPAAALTDCVERTPDLILLDYHMPQMSGLDFVRRARADAALRDVPIVIVTGEEKKEALYEALRSGANDFLRKPVDEMELHARASSLLHLRGRQLAIIEARAHVESMFNSAFDAMVTIDQRGIVLSFNRAAERLFGYAAAEVIGQNVSILMPEPHASRHDAYLERYASSRQARIVGIGRELTGRRKDGGEFPLDLAVSEFVSGDGGHHFVGCMRDLTERRRAQEQVVHAQRLDVTGQLTGGIAHEFNNLLAIILGNLSMLRRHGALDELSREMVEESIGATRRSAELTQRLLAFSGRQALQPQPTDLHKAIEGIAPTLQHPVGPGIEIQTTLVEGLWADIDPGQFEAALLCLALNAREAMLEGGVLAIDTRRETVAQGGGSHADLQPGDYAVVVVRDTGVGMTPDVLKRAVEPFFTTRAFGKGTGLGLSMVYGFAKQSGGHLLIESAPGQGTTVALYFPIAHPVAAPAMPSFPRAPAAPKPVVAPAESPKRSLDDRLVLVVDDEREVRKMACMSLRDLGLRVLEADDGHKALDLLDARPEIDLLLTDVMMPNGLTGHDLARVARARRPTLPILFMSGFIKNYDHVLAAEIADVPLIAKPFDPDRLTEVVCASLASSSQ